METEKTNIENTTTSQAETVLGSMPSFEEHMKEIVTFPSKDEIRTTVCEKLDSEEKIKSFITDQLNRFEAIAEEKTVGQNYTDSFRDFISSKIHYKSTDKMNGKEAPDLVYDDIQPYEELISTLHKKQAYTIPTLCNEMFYIIRNYLPSSGDISKRFDAYYKGFFVNGKTSIKEIRENKAAFCSEKAGLSHNMFKMLGIDSELVAGSRENEPHAYNLIYPYGYNGDLTVLYDPSHTIDFTNNNQYVSTGFFKALSKDELQKLKSGEPITIDDLSSTEQSYRNRYNLDGFNIANPKPVTYTYGLKSE